MDPEFVATAADVVRVVVVALACLVVGAILAVIRLHAKALRRAPSDTGLVSRHVVTISVAHACFVVGTALGTYDQIGLPSMNWRLYLYILGSILTLAALVIIGRGQRRRVRRSPVRTRVVEERDTIIDVPGRHRASDT